MAVKLIVRLLFIALCISCAVAGRILEPCPGVCVDERLAEYCETILAMDGMCKSGLRCCVPRDVYSDSDPSGNLIIMHRVISRPTSTSPRPSTTSATANTQPAQPSLPQKPCRGQCVSEFFQLLCDNIDTEAVCPGGDSCCISDAPTSDTTPSSGDFNTAEPVTTTTSKPATTTAVSTSTPAPPRCPGVCILNIMAAFCRRPSVLIPYTTNCRGGSVCCDNTRSSSASRPSRPEPQSTTTTTPATSDGRPDCSGSCIVPYSSFPSYIKKCKINDEKCYVESAQAALPHFVNGDKKVKLQPLNPFVIDKVEVEQGGLKFKLTDAKLFFTDGLKILSVRADLEKHKFEYTFSSPNCKLLSDYEVEGKILVVPISGKGKANITVVDVVLHFSHDTAHEVREDGKKYVKFLTGHHETKNISRAYFDLTNLFNGDKTLSEHTLKFMNENWQDVYTELNPLLLDVLVEQEKVILNRVAGAVPLDELFYHE